MPKLSTRQEGLLYSAFASYLLASKAPDAQERKLHMQMCNHALLDAGLPIFSDLLRSFTTSLNLLEDQEGK
jgi:hypothetical protein